MATTKIFSVRDSKAEAYMAPLFLPTKGIAIRMFADAIADSKHQFGSHPEDYHLFELGEFDDSTGSFTLHPSPVSVGGALEFVKTSE